MKGFVHVYSSDGLRIHGFRVEPKHAEGKLPVIVWCHGGAGVVAIVVRQLVVRVDQHLRNCFAIRGTPLVYALVKPHLHWQHHALPTMEATAKKLALSKRTLQLRIEAEGTSYHRTPQETLANGKRQLAHASRRRKTLSKLLGWTSGDRYIADRSHSGPPRFLLPVSGVWRLGV